MFYYLKLLINVTSTEMCVSFHESEVAVLAVASIFVRVFDFFTTATISDCNCPCVFTDHCCEKPVQGKAHSAEM